MQRGKFSKSAYRVTVDEHLRNRAPTRARDHFFGSVRVVANVDFVKR